MYPFERFTEDAKKVLTLAQKEAERSHHSYIGTEHLLLGILGLKRGNGYDALVELGISIDVVRQTIQNVLGRNERIIIQQIIPTSRVKTVIEIAFQEARRMDQNFVDSGHLLMALVIEGEGVAAHVLEDLGADSIRVVSAVERLMGAPPSGRGKDPRFATQSQPPVGARLVEPPFESNAEALARLLRNPRIANLLRARGVTDLEGLAAKLDEPPADVLRLRMQLRNTQQMQHDIRRQLDRAEEDWLRNITD